jgi:hypothetical protein
MYTIKYGGAQNRRAFAKALHTKKIEGFLQKPCTPRMYTIKYGGARVGLIPHV